MEAHIYKPTRTAMQSGQANTREWCLEFAQQAPRRVDSLMGWTSSSDTTQQLALHFDTKEAAIAYAEAHGLAYTVSEPESRAVRRRAYADNFRYDRVR